MTAFTGKIISPARLGDPYLYEITHTGGVVRIGTTPEIPDDYDTFILHYAETDDKLFDKPSTELWDLTILFKNAKPREISVQVKIAGNVPFRDKPTVRDGMM